MSSISYQFTHKIADIIFATKADHNFTLLENGLFAKFMCESNSPDVQQRIFQVKVGSESLPVSIGDGELEAHANLLQAPNIRSRLVQILDDARRVEIVADNYQVVARDFSHREIDFFYRKKEGSNYNNFKGEFIDLGFPLAYTLRQIFSTFLPIFSAALIHSSGVMRNDLVSLFLAPSTGGKTTVIGLSNDGFVLSDDQVILRKKADKVIAYGTPFGRVTDGPNCADLGGLFLLEKAERFELISIKPADMLEYMWSAQLQYTYLLPMEIRTQAYQVLYDTCHQVPCYLMRFPKDQVDWDAIDKAMRR
jgi:hypothetical protein